MQHDEADNRPIWERIDLITRGCVSPEQRSAALAVLATLLASEESIRAIEHLMGVSLHQPRTA